MARSTPDDSHSRLDDLQGSHAALRLVQMLNHLNNLQRIFARHSHYNPNQPRVPAGHPTGGEWTRTGADAARGTLAQPQGSAWPLMGGGGGSVEPTAATIAVADENPWPLIAAAIGGKPRIPTRRPGTSRERTEALKEAAKWLRENAGQAIEGIPWLDEFLADIKSYLDPPRTLEELQQAVSEPKKGYDIHHIAEQSSAEEDGFPRRIIDGPENRERIPRIRHRAINGWYGRPNKDFGWKSPREYLRGKSWEERTRIGLEALREHGVLKR
jgi:hypothetical protein